jgi:cholesterol oxidase
MPRLSSSLQQLKKHYEIVVVGSGYGGGAAASRLARAGRQVCLLERGREMQPSEYPDNSWKMVTQTQLDLPQRHIGSETGLFDLRINDDINVFQGCGLGGTSLINGGVSLRVLPRILDDERWPEAIRHDVKNGADSPFGLLDGYYKRAEDMLRPRTWPGNYPVLAKMQAMKQVAAAQNLPWAPVPINVTFEPFKNGLNHVGVPQKPCIACGDCAAGCNHSAKNTVLMNYLPDAKNHGAEIFTGLSVKYLEKKDGQWVLHCRTTDHSPTEMTITAERVVLAAGTVGTNEILMRSRERGLPLSDSLGTLFSGNGDVVGWSYNTNQTINNIGFGNRSPRGRTPVGPFAGSIIDARETHDFLIIEGSLPGGMAYGIAAILTLLNTQGVDTRGPRSVSEKLGETMRILSSLVNPFSGATTRSQAYLVVNQDDGQGRMFLKNDRLRISWPNIGRAPVFEQTRKTLTAATKLLGGSFLTDMRGKDKGSQGLLTGHPTGGACMSESAETGVTNHKGQLYSSTSGTETHQGLYCMDAAIIPRCIGVNPLLTISALAERCCEHMAKDEGWTIDYSMRDYSAATA